MRKKEKEDWGERIKELKDHIDGSNGRLRDDWKSRRRVEKLCEKVKEMEKEGRMNREEERKIREEMNEMLAWKMDREKEKEERRKETEETVAKERKSKSGQEGEREEWNRKEIV